MLRALVAPVLLAQALATGVAVPVPQTETARAADGSVILSYAAIRDGARAWLAMAPPELPDGLVLDAVRASGDDRLLTIEAAVHDRRLGIDGEGRAYFAGPDLVLDSVALEPTLRHCKVLDNGCRAENATYRTRWRQISAAMTDAYRGRPLLAGVGEIDLADENGAVESTTRPGPAEALPGGVVVRPQTP